MGVPRGMETQVSFREASMTSMSRQVPQRTTEPLWKSTEPPQMVDWMELPVTATLDLERRAAGSKMILRQDTGMEERGAAELVKKERSCQDMARRRT